MMNRTRLFCVCNIATGYRQQRFASIYKKVYPIKKTKSHRERALEYFDHYYKVVYGDKWPSIRISLLSRQKYCAMVNNFSDVDRTVTKMASAGSSNVIDMAENNVACELTQNKFTKVGKLNPRRTSEAVTTTENQEEAAGTNYANIPGVVTSDSDLYDFMPPKRILSEKEEEAQEEMEHGFYKPNEMNVSVIPGDRFKLPEHLKVFVHDRGEVELFPPIRMDKARILSHFIMDAASILPVLALDLRSDDMVLDLCSAPGAKTLTMLQTLLPGKLVCVDSSGSRLDRLQNILNTYVPQSFFADDKVNILKADGVTYCESVAANPQFDKVLVDVPCNTDRHVLNNDDNNLFKPGRAKERHQLKDIQLSLLCGALKAVKPGGSVVYSTCTLAMPQNDGAIQAALERIWTSTKIDVVVEDISNIVDHFKTVFDFFPGCRFGQMVLPNLTANCGPMYFCKLRRLK